MTTEPIEWLAPTLGAVVFAGQWAWILAARWRVELRRVATAEGYAVGLAVLRRAPA